MASLNLRNPDAIDQLRIGDDGITVVRSKNSKTNLVEWSPRLSDVHQAALNLRVTRKLISLGDDWLVPGPRGGQLSEATLQAAMQRLKRLMESKGMEGIYWTLHELKHKGITDAEDKNIAGHKSESMKQKYDHSRPRNKSVK